MEQKPKEPKPFGSGVFALICGIIFVLVGLIIVLCGYDVSKLDPSTILNIWLFSGGVILIGWGVQRIRKWRTPKTRKLTKNWDVGQNTINFTMGFVAATIAILALLIKT